LLPLCDDEDADVRREAQRAFRNTKVFAIPDAHRVLTQYIRSKAFADDPSPLIWSLKEFTGNLTQFVELVLMICEVFAGKLRDASRDTSTGIAGDAHMIPPLLLRLYEQAQDQGDAQVLNRCLDACDVLFENRVGVTRDWVHAMEQ
jgi:hypothetical protein